MKIKLLLICISYLTFSSAPMYAGVFIAAEQYGSDIIAHPQGYTGDEDQVTVRVCIVPGSPNATAMQAPIQNVVATYNNLTPTAGNLSLGADNNIPANALDFESVALHEIGHCLGLAHPNLASESGLNGNNTNYTKTLKGGDNSYDLNDGVDNVIGSDDDLRGDDINLHWFRKANNNPFNTALPTVIDASTWSRDINLLPGNGTFAANADRNVSLEFGYPLTEAVMQQGAVIDETRRTLAADDVATLRLAMSGLDESYNQANDNYNLTLQYVGISNNNCDINVSFDNDETGLAVCLVQGVFLNNSHFGITQANIYFNTDPNWAFVDTTNTPPVANNDNYQTDENIQLVVNAPGILNNDSDVDDDDLVVQQLVNNVDHGNLNLYASGAFTYTPDEDYTGPDSFSYRISDGEAQSNIATVNITVIDNNTPPVANNDNYQVTKNTQLVVGAPGILSNDSDIDDDDLIVGEGAYNFEHGELTLYADGKFIYTPNPDYIGPDSFIYKISDGQALSNIATVNITVVSDAIFADGFE